MTLDDAPPAGETPTLVFSPLAWLKLQYMCHAGGSEVGGFGVARDAGNPLYVDDFYTVPQDAGWAHVDFDDVGVADFAEDRVAEGLKPHQFLRIWVHTHPGNSPHPSGTDEDTFAERFGDCDWAVMFILAKGGDVYARLKFTSPTGLTVSVLVGVAVDWSGWCGQADQLPGGTDAVVAAWRLEYETNVRSRRTDGGRWSSVEVRADTYRKVRPEAGPGSSRLRPGEPGFTAFGAAGDADAVEEIDDGPDDDMPMVRSLAEVGLDLDDLFEMRDEDLTYHGFSADDIVNIRAGRRLKVMSDADYAEFRAAWEFWFEEDPEELKDDDDDPAADDDVAPRKQSRTFVKGRVRPGD